MSLYWVLFIGISLLSFIVQSVLQSRFNKYSQIPIDGGLTGRDVAERMLREHGIYDVQVTCIPGALTDHYDPRTKTVRLSEGIYDKETILISHAKYIEKFI